MNRLISCFILALSLSGCMSEMARQHAAHNAAVLGYGTVPQFGTNVEAVSQPRSLHEYDMRGPPKWEVGCETGITDQFGDRKREYCWLLVNNHDNPGVLMDDNSSAMKWEMIFEVDAEGATFRKPARSFACDGRGPQRIAVDGKRIDQLSEKDQIEAVLKGSRLVREEQSKWPYCAIGPHGTYLQGIRPGYDRMMQQWRALHSHQ